ncbi:chitin deacetylase 8-like [Euwallacea fornicatus]|uniref:chitin deacetylase 8-like n=1 Tax=Euwallacea fornicatus TaxID=995702 RepID=UPI00338FAA01
MKVALAALLVLTVFLQKSLGDKAKECVLDECKIENNCRCTSTEGPLSIDDTPQLIVLAFIDAARQETYDKIWSPLVESRKNPDGEFVSASFYINHEYSNYQIVHDLATMGFEIGVHSVTNYHDQKYWREASEELLEKEFGAQRKIIEKFANIPTENLIGVLTPQLQLAGDNSILAFTSQGFTYDNSWPSKNSLFPYTLDYLSDQECIIGANCPEQSYPGFWEAPIIDLVGNDGDVCNTLAGCFRKYPNLTSGEFSDWLVEQVDKVKTSNKAPMTLIIEQNLFESVENSWDGLIDALDRIQKDNQVFLVSQARVIEWMKNPVPLSEFTTNPVTIDTGCVKAICDLLNEDNEARTMISCVPCPKRYPWLDNPEGN